MATNVESMFYVRDKPWHGLGTMVAEAPNSAAALRLAGLDWNVAQKDIMMVDSAPPSRDSRQTCGTPMGVFSGLFRTGTGWFRTRRRSHSRYEAPMQDGAEQVQEQDTADLESAQGIMEEVQMPPIVLQRKRLMVPI